MMKSLFWILGVLTAISGASQYATAADPKDSVNLALAAGTNPTDLKFTPSGNALGASDVVITWQIWDPTANNNKGAWVGFGGNVTTLPVGMGVINPTGAATTSTITFTSGKKFRALVDLKRGGDVKASNVSNEVVAP